MARTRRRQPYDPGKVHDRRSTDKLKDAQLAPQEVDDPLGLEPGDKIVVMRNVRSDPLALLHARNSIDDAQYEGGRAFQRDFEEAGQGPRAIDYEAPAVDCSRVDRSLSPKVSKALSGLAKAYRELEQDGSAIMHDFLIERLTMAGIARKRGLVGRQWDEYFGLHVRRLLHKLAYVYGFTSEKHGRGRVAVNPIKIG